MNRPYVLSIAGFDPSGGAGILADIKAFEANEVYGLGVCSAITYQNDIEFEKVDWVNKESMKDQIQILFKRFKVEWVKIGLLESLGTLEEIVVFLKSLNRNIKIIWDPILKASAGFEFHKNLNKSLLKDICNDLFLITPNLIELEILFPEKEEEEAAILLREYCSVLIKGGHRLESSNDILFTNERKYVLESSRISEIEKRGTGCVLSSSILSCLAKGDDLYTSCLKGKRYIEHFIKSNSTKLGYHVNF